MRAIATLARHVGAVLGLAVVFVVAALAGLVLHGGSPVVRRIVVGRVNGVLATAVAGKIVIERLDAIRLHGVDGVDVRIDDPEGVTVLRATGVTARVALVPLARSLLQGGEVVVDLHAGSIARADVNLDSDPGGEPRIARAMAPRARPDTGPAKPVRVTIAAAHLGHASVRGQPRGSPPIDLDVDDATATAVIAPPRVTVDLTHARATVRFALPGARPGEDELRGDVEGHLARPPSGTGAGDIGVALRGSFAGTVGLVAGRAEASYDAGKLDAVVDVPSASPQQVRALLPSWPVSEPLALRVEAHGAVPRLDVRAHATLGSGVLDVTGPVTLAPLQATLHVDGKAIDPRRIVASAPPSDVSASGSVSIATTASGATTARVALDFARGRVGATPTPPAELTGEIVRGPPPAAELSATARLAIREPGAPVNVTARLASVHGAMVVSFDGDVLAPHLEDVQILRGAASGKVGADVSGTFDLATGTVDARITAMAEGLASGVSSLLVAHGEAHVTGPIGAPFADVDLAAEGVDAGPLRVSAVQSRARFEIMGGAFHDLDLRVDEGGEEARIRAALVQASSGEVRLDDAEVDGFGQPLQATLRGTATSLFVRVGGKEIDLGRLARFAHWSAIRGGRVALDVEATIGRGKADGQATVDLAGADIATLRDVSGRANVTLHGRKVDGQASVRMGDVGTLDVRSSGLELGGRGALDAGSWRRTWGAIDVGAHVDLARLAATLPPRVLPIDQMRGLLDVTARAERDSAADVTPELNFSARTTGLSASGRRAAGRWAIDQVDPEVDVTIDGQTGATELAAHVRDATGDIATMTASSSAVPYSTLLLGGALGSALEAMPFDARVEVVPRTVESLPRWFGMAGSTGRVRGSVAWHGAAVSPVVDVVGNWEAGVVDARAFALPADVEWSAHYDGAHATARLLGSVRDRRVVQASAEAEVRAPDILDALGGVEVPWNGAAHVKLDGFPLQGVVALDDRLVRGRATGTFLVEKLHDDAHASLSFSFDGLKVGDAACRAATVDASIDGKTMKASLHVDQDEGSITAHAYSGAHWGKALVPGLDVAQPAGVTLSAKAFRAAILLPLVSKMFSDFDGRVDGDAGISVDLSTSRMHPQGTLTLKDGSFELNSLGGEFTGVSATLKATQDGIVRLTDVRAHSLDGFLTAAATARFNGLAFGGAEATIQIPRTAPLPIVFDGVQIGIMDGNVEATMAEAPGDKALDVKLDVPTLHLLLPSGATHDVQTLGELEGVRTGVVREGEGFVAVPLDPVAEQGPAGPPRKPIDITVKLGKDVEIRRAAGGAGQPDLKMTIEGQPSVRIDDRVRASGQIALVHGSIGVGGKPFEIEKGTVAFEGDDPTNPQVVLRAGWTAPDGTRVTADFIGPLKTGKVTLHADPAPPGGESGILALLLFGSADQGSAGSPTTGASPVAGIAGGAATAPINKALGGVNSALEKFGLGGGLTTKVDTSQANPRPEVELQIARDISLEVAWVLGLPPPGMPDTTLVTFNWRFLRKWSLLTTVGNTGTSILDVVWQHRY